MARLIPPRLSKDSPSSERVVHAALARLPEPWVVLADIPMGLFGRPKPGMAQLDFLLIHPARGLCVLEVKGGAIEVREGTWYTTPQGGEVAGQPQELRRSPFAQAAQQRFELQRFLWKHLAIADDAMAHAVALPDCTGIIEGSLGPDAPRGIIVDRRDLQSVEAAAERAMKTWNTRVSLSDDEVEKLIRLLKPSFDLTIVLAAEVVLTEEGLQRETRRQVHATDGQVDAFQAMLREERLAVMGEAGTGKTVLAVERAKRLSQTGLRTLLLCHRSGVAAFMRTILGGGVRRRLDLDALEDLTVTPFGELLGALAEVSGRKGPSTNAAVSADWVLGASEDVGLQFGALVVDEAQEFTSAQLDALLFLLADPDESPVYLFADPFQHSAVFSTGRMERSKARGRFNWTPPVGMQTIMLTDNVRNSAPISQTVKQFLVAQLSVARVAGSKPEILNCKRKDVIHIAFGRTQELLKREGFRPNQVLIVGVGIDRSDLLRVANKAPFDVTGLEGIVRFPLPSTDLRVAVGVPDDVQGLEAQVVVVLDLTNDFAIGEVRDFYVAASRARSHLIIVSPRGASQLQSAARAALEAER